MKNLFLNFVIALLLFTSCNHDQINDIDDSIDEATYPVNITFSGIEVSTSNLRTKDIDTTMIHYKIFNDDNELYLEGSLEPNQVNFEFFLPSGDFYIVSTTWDQSTTINFDDIYPSNGGYYGSIHEFSIHPIPVDIEVPLYKKYAGIDFRIKDGDVIPNNVTLEITLVGYYQQFSPEQMVEDYRAAGNLDGQHTYGTFQEHPNVAPYDVDSKREVSWTYSGGGTRYVAPTNDFYNPNTFNNYTELIVRVIGSSGGAGTYYIQLPSFEMSTKLNVTLDLPNETMVFQKQSWTQEINLDL